MKNAKKMCWGCDGAVRLLTDPERVCLETFVKTVTQNPQSPCFKDPDRARLAWHCARSRLHAHTFYENYRKIRYFETEEQSLLTQAKMETERRNRLMRKRKVKELLAGEGLPLRSVTEMSTWIAKHAGLAGFKRMIDAVDVRFRRGFVLRAGENLWRLE